MLLMVCLLPEVRAPLSLEVAAIVLLDSQNHTFDGCSSLRFEVVTRHKGLLSLVLITIVTLG
jgi:hypothetical protein